MGRLTGKLGLIGGSKIKLGGAGELRLRLVLLTRAPQSLAPF